MKKTLAAGSLIALLFWFSTLLLAQKRLPTETPDIRMSSMGRAAQLRLREQAPAPSLLRVRQPQDCGDTIRCLALDQPGGTQSETTIAIDDTGQNIVIGFNDFRGFANDPVSLSGYMYSNDGGRTFVDGGQLPSPGTAVIGGQRFPQIFGDPDVKYLGGCNFIYASLMLKEFGTGLAQTLGIHRSTDCGQTWTGPIEVTPATNPNILIDVGGNAVDAADKELMEVDPDTGRVVIGWTNFTPVAPGFVEISSTYTDNILSPNPTFAPRKIIAAAPADGQGAAVGFAGNGSPNSYIAWSRSSSFYTRAIAFSRSTDNGVTWSAPVNLTADFLTMDQVLGNDRVNSFPSIAVDQSPGLFQGNVYIVYSNNNSGDGADVAFQRSTDGGLTFSPPILLNARPGNDRAQWFPFVTADRSTGRVTVFYYDQGIDSSGHLTEVTYLFSDDGGITWSKPAPLSEKPFKAGWGNDTSQPNLGDYNQAVSRFGIFHAAYAATRPVGFADGQPGVQFPVPDVFFAKVPPDTSKLALRLGDVFFSETGADGNIDPGETVSLKIPLRNYVTNPLSASVVGGVTATLRVLTPGVTVAQAVSDYPALPPGGVGLNASDYVVTVSSAFPIGTPIEFELEVVTSGASIRLPFTQSTGTYVFTTLLSEDFESAPPGSLPPAWRAVHGAGDNTVPWTSSNTFCGNSNKAFHANAEDGPAEGSPARWERLLSPVVTIPGNADDVLLEFDVCYDTEEDPFFRVQAYDGFFLRITDLTPGRVPRSVLAEAFEQEFFTGPIKHYPKHFPRSNDPAYFADMSAWAGNSGGQRRVRMRLPGMAGSTVQLRFEYTQDSNSTCADLRPGNTCGVSIDNVVMRSLRVVAPPEVVLNVRPQLRREGEEIVATLMVSNTGTAPASDVQLTNVTLNATPTSTSPLPALGTIPAGGSASATVRFPNAGGPGAAAVLRVVGTHGGGNFGGSFRVTLP